jgi:hypothetical protein
VVDRLLLPGQVPTPPVSVDVSSAWPAALTAGLVAALTGLFVGAWILRILGSARPAPPDQDERSHPPAPDAGEQAPASSPEPPQIIPDRRSQVLQNQRAALVRGLAEMLGTMPEELAWQARNVLQAGGVHAVVPDGEFFDPGMHQAVGTEPVVDGARPETVARTVRAGYADEERMLVPPRVVVYVSQASTGTLR